MVYGPVAEGPQSSVSFRIVTRASPARQITVLFSTRPLTASGKQIAIFMQTLSVYCVWFVFQLRQILYQELVSQ